MSPARSQAGRAAAAAALSDGLDYESLWGALPTPCVALAPDDRFVAANAAAEHFFGRSSRSLRQRRLSDVCGGSSRVVEVAGSARQAGLSLTEYGVEISVENRAPTLVDLQAAHIFDAPGHIALLLQPRSVAAAMDRSFAHHGAARSLSGLSAMLAHEIKNPLAGISGAAQLLEMTLGDAERELIQIIQEETARISELLERMDAFGDPGPIERRPLNIHDVLDQARRAAAAGFASHIRFREEYDPSLPPVPGARDQLLQVISNLLKNAAEAAPRAGGEIRLSTAFKPGVKLSVAGGARESLPIEITVTDNGPGVPESLRPHLFEPFVTSKADGKGLGLSLVAKIVSDHGGIIEYQRVGARTIFRILMPVWSEPVEPALHQPHSKHRSPARRLRPVNPHAFRPDTERTEEET